MNKQRFIRVGLAFELLLGLIGLGLGSWNETMTLRGEAALGLPTTMDMLYGLLATVPLIVAMVFMHRSQWSVFRDLRTLVHRDVVPLFQGIPWWWLLALGLAAGFGEELLFRGFLQRWLINLVGPMLGIALAALVFGWLHRLSTTYAVLATACGVYLGIIDVVTQRLWIVIVAHAAYDVIAIGYLVRRAPRNDEKVEAQENRDVPSSSSDY